VAVPWVMYDRCKNIAPVGTPTMAGEFILHAAGRWISSRAEVPASVGDGEPRQAVVANVTRTAEAMTDSTRRPIPGVGMA
jgi:hypothetical protein